jgi:hypothetical protein
MMLDAEVTEYEEAPTELRSEDEPQPALPRWFIALLAAAVCWCATASTVAMVALAYDFYNPAVAIGAGSLAALAAIALVRRPLSRPTRADHGPALVAVAIAMLFFALAGVWHSEHLLSDRDPGVYVNSGRLIARTQELHPKIDPTFQPGYSLSASGFGTRNDRYFANFFPMLPALLALGWSAGGDTGLLLVPALLGALGLLVVYAIASRLIGPRWALIAPAVLLVVPIELWFARDAYSELLVQTVALGGLWWFLDARDRASPIQAGFAGLIVACTTMARIDALAVVASVFALLGIEWLRASAEARSREGRQAVIAFAAGLSVMTLLGMSVTRRVGHGYIHSFQGDYNRARAELVLAILVSIGAVVAHRIWPGIGHRLARSRALFAGGAIVGIALVLYAYVVRPDRRALPDLVPGQALSRAVRQARNAWHWSRSLHWFSSYFGIIAIVLAVGGLGVIIWLALRGNSAATMVSVVVIPFMLVYLARPSITADQPWAMRRYLPVVIPGIALAIAVGFGTVWRRTRASTSARVRLGGAVAVVLLALGVAIPGAMAFAPFAQARAQHGAMAGVRRICSEAGDDGAILIVGHQFIDLELPQTLRSFCGIPTAKPRVPGADLVALAKTVQSRGHRLLVATGSPDAIRNSVPTAKELTHVTIDDAYSPERSADHRPRHYDPRPREVWLFEIPPAASGAPAQ